MRIRDMLHFEFKEMYKLWGGMEIETIIWLYLIETVQVLYNSWSISEDW